MQYCCPNTQNPKTTFSLIESVLSSVKSGQRDDGIESVMRIWYRQFISMKKERERPPPECCLSFSLELDKINGLLLRGGGTEIRLQKHKKIVSKKMRGMNLI